MDSLSLDKLIEHLDETFRALPDHRRGSNPTYEIREAALAAFSVFMMQSPSFLAHQRDLERRKGFNNVTSLLGAAQIGVFSMTPRKGTFQKSTLLNCP